MTSWHDSVLTETQRDVLRAIAPLTLMRESGFYLAGGTAVALRSGHRRSIDFDWFTSRSFDCERVATTIRDARLSLEVTQLDRGTLLGQIEGVKVSFFEYRYQLLASLEQLAPYGIEIASLRDLAAMKLLAVAQRGTRKDFVDVHELLRRGASLKEMLADFVKKFDTDPLNALRGLAYFDDAEQEPMPEMLRPAEWPTMRREIEQAVREVLK